MTIKKQRPTNCKLSVLWWNLFTNFIHLGGPLLWHKDGQLYVIGVNAATYGNCSKYEDSFKARNLATTIHNYLGWILNHVSGEMCGTEDKINEWFDQAGEQDDITIWE